MPVPWQQLLQGASARWQDNELTAFTEPVAEARQALASDIIAPLPSLAIVEVSGADATEFLHSQLSNDIRALPEHGSCLAAYCNPKGRMLALFRVVRRADSLLLLFPAGLVESTLKRLRLYVLRSKVTFTDLGDQWAAMGISGPNVAARLATLGLSLPEQVDEGASHEDALVLRLPGATPRGLIVAPQQRIGRLWSALDGLERVGEQAWRLLKIRAGVPEVLPGAVEKFIPQAANLDLLNGISFSKGCYPGQEIVARLHYRGNVNRRMYRLTLESAALPAPGTDVRTVDGSLAGELVMAAPGPDGGTEALAVLQVRQAGERLLVDGHAATAEAPPYLPEPQAE